MASFSSIAIIPAICLTLLTGWFCFIQFNHGTTNGVVVASQKQFDYLLLALQWPATYCRLDHECCPSNACCRGSNSPTGFTIHGLWVDYNDGSWPSCCNGPEFDVKEISTLHDGLNKYWPTLTCSPSSTCNGKEGLFLAHEWEKHGTCAYPFVEDEYDYFLKSINLYLKYNVTEIWSEAQYIASNSEKYPVEGMISAVQNAFQATPQIICTGSALQEIRLCFYKDFTPRDCDATSSLKGRLYSNSCPDYISLPVYTSTELEKNGTALSWITGKSSI